MKNEKKKILVVEDNFMSKTLVRDILIMKGFDVVSADRGTEALQLVATEAPDLILMDINMPGMDGITAARLIKSSQAGMDVPILALTASAMKGDDEKIMGQGFDGYVAKPIDVNELMKLVEEKLL